MTYSIIVIGCQMNKADGERLSFYLENLGFRKIDNFLKADLVAIITCGVKQMAEDRVYGLVEKITRNNKKAVIAISGCLSDRVDVQTRLKNKVDIWFNIATLGFLNKSLKKYFPNIKNFSSSKFNNYLDISANYLSTFSAFVPIGNGCNNFCSYCVVPYARNREVYRSSEDIIKEVKNLIKKGYKEITLIAQNVNSYKSNIDFPGLLKIIDNLPGDFWLRFSTSHPKDVSPKLIKVLKRGKHICEHFHLAVQSGDNDILKSMNRKYKVEKYKKLVKDIRLAMDGKNNLPTAITTDIIVGYPGETEKNFSKTKKLFQELKFDLAFISKYSPRPLTASFNLPDNVSLSDKKEREKELNKLLKKHALSNNKKYVGKEVLILLEGTTRKGELFGRTRTSKLVKIVVDKSINNNRCLIGQFIKVKIIKAKEFELIGKIIV